MAFYCDAMTFSWAISIILRERLTPEFRMHLCGYVSPSLFAIALFIVFRNKACGSCAIGRMLRFFTEPNQFIENVRVTAERTQIFQIDHLWCDQIKCAVHTTT